MKPQNEFSLSDIKFLLSNTCKFFVKIFGIILIGIAIVTINAEIEKNKLTNTDAERIIYPTAQK